MNECKTTETSKFIKPISRLIILFILFFSCRETPKYFIIEVPTKYEGYLFLVFDSNIDNAQKLIIKGQYFYTKFEYETIKFISEPAPENFHEMPIVIKNKEAITTRNEFGGKDLDMKKIFQNKVDSIFLGGRISFIYKAFVTTDFYLETDSVLKKLILSKEYQLNEFKNRVGK